MYNISFNRRPEIVRVETLVGSQRTGHSHESYDERGRHLVSLAIVRSPLHTLPVMSHITSSNLFLGR